MGTFKLRLWTKADIPILVKFLNNKKILDNCRDSLPYRENGAESDGK